MLNMRYRCPPVNSPTHWGSTGDLVKLVVATVVWRSKRHDHAIAVLAVDYENLWKHPSSGENSGAFSKAITSTNNVQNSPFRKTRGRRACDAWGILGHARVRSRRSRSTPDILVCFDASIPCSRARIWMSTTTEGCSRAPRINPDPH